LVTETNSTHRPTYTLQNIDLVGLNVKIHCHQNTSFLHENNADDKKLPASGVSRRLLIKQNIDKAAAVHA